MGFSSLVTLLRHRADEDPDRLAYVFRKDGQGEENLTYGELDRRARRIGSLLKEAGCEGERVLINHLPGLDYIASFFGTLYAGAVAVPVYPPRFSGKLDRLMSIVGDARPAAALTSKGLLENMTLQGNLKDLRWIDSLTGGDESFQPGNPGNLAFMQYTSGSTSAPKGVMLTHGNLLENLRCITEGFEIQPESDRAVVWLPPYHDMGLIGGILVPLFSRIPILLMSPYAFLQRPHRWLEAVSQFKATISGAPNFAFDLCTRRVTEAQMETLDLSSLKIAFCGAEPIQERVLRNFSEKFARVGFRHRAFYPCYGLAEATLMVSGSKVSEDPTIFRAVPQLLEKEGIAEPDASGRAYVGCGRPATGHKIRIVDPVTLKPCPEGKVGEIWFSGPSVAAGYWNQSSNTFQGKVDDPDDEDQYLRTGDLGFLREGELFVTGRRKELLILRGCNHYPQDIEGTVQASHSALRPGAGAAFSVEGDSEEKLVIVQELERRSKESDLGPVVEAIRQAVFENHGLTPHAISLVKANTIPVTSSGKIQRTLCRQWFLEGKLS